MRIYRNCKETASETKRELAEMGVEVQLDTMQDKKVSDNPDYVTKELVAYSYAIRDVSDKDELLIAFNKLEEGKVWAEAEFKDRVGEQRLNPGEAWKHREQIWEEFIHDGKFSYTYSERMGSQVRKAIDALKNNKGCRNAIVAMWDPNVDIDNIGGKKRVPCTMYYQALVRNGEVHMIYNIRSNDLFTHWCYDIWLAIKLQEYIASELGLPVGTFYQHVGSLHGYMKDMRGIF